jgi:hypothetical protein
MLLQPGCEDLELGQQGSLALSAAREGRAPDRWLDDRAEVKVPAEGRLYQRHALVLPPRVEDRG